MSVALASAAAAPLCLADLVRSVDREPRIPDLTLAERLGFKKPHNIRKLVDRNRAELMTYGALIERASSFLRDGEKPARRGRPGTMYFLNEGQALVVCALSRTPVAAKVRQDVIAVYMAHRRGMDWLPPAEQERQCLREIVERGHAYPVPEPIWLEPTVSCESGIATHVLVLPATEALLETLATFEVELEDLEDGRDAEEGEDAEPSLGWGPNIGQLELGPASEDGDSTAPEAHGDGFRGCGPDDAEPDADGEPDEDGEPWLGAPERHPSGNLLWGYYSGAFIRPSFDGNQENWAEGPRSVHGVDREEDAGDEGEPSEDDEASLGWAPNVGQLALGPNTEDGDETAIERHGAGFVRSGGDDMEGSSDAEPDGDGEPTLGWPNITGGPEPGRSLSPIARQDGSAATPLPLTMVTEVPDGCFMLPVATDRFRPWLHPGQWAVIDRSNRAPVSGGLFFVRYPDGHGWRDRLVQIRSSIFDGRHQPFLGWMIHFETIRPRLGCESADELADLLASGAISLCDGPISDMGMRSRIVGRVVGVASGRAW